MEEKLKKKSGQSGSDGNPYLRNRRIEMRVSPQERAEIVARASASASPTLAQFVRDSALHGATGRAASHRDKLMLACQYELNRIGTHLSQLERQAKEEGASEEILMVLMQIQELAESEFHRARYVSDGASS